MSWSCSILPGPPTSPVGDVMQTPQFQLRRLKKQLALERDNRDELELELAENRKLITEKGQCLARGGSWGLGGVSGAEICFGTCCDSSDPLPKCARAWCVPAGVQPKPLGFFCCPKQRGHLGAGRASAVPRLHHGSLL